MTDLKRLIDWCDSFRACPGECDRANELATLLRSAARADAERFSSAINIAAVEAEADRQSKRLPNFFRECFRAEFPGDVDALAFASHLLSEHDADLASLAEKQRAIDEAMALAPHGGLMMSILRPHATPAATVKTRTVTVIDPTDDAKQRVTYTDRPQGPPRRWTSALVRNPQRKVWCRYRAGLDKWFVDLFDSHSSVIATRPDELFIEWVEGDTVETLPNPDKNPDTVPRSQPADDTRERIVALERLTQELASAHASDPGYANSLKALDLIATLAECITGLIEETDKDGYPENNWTVPLREIITTARKGAKQ